MLPATLSAGNRMVNKKTTTTGMPLMFLVSLNYIKPIEVIDEYLPQHREFLDRHYAADRFLLSGRKEPRTGGIILVDVDSQQQLQDILAQDPFHQHDVAEYAVTQFTPTMAAPALKALLPA